MNSGMLFSDQKRILRANPVLLSFLALVFFQISGSLYGVDSGIQSARGALSLLINTAQNNSLGVLLSSSTNGLLFCGSDDGSINVYKNGTQLVQHLQVSNNPIRRIAYDGDTRLTCLEQTPNKSFRLSLWNWKKAVVLWSVDLNEQALSLTFSPKGTFIVCTLARWNSILFLDASTGSVKPWLSSGFGIVDFALVSSREERVMCYNAGSGFLSYQDLTTGQEIKRLGTPSKLRQFQLVLDNSRSKAVALDGSKVVVIDLVSGKVLSSQMPGFLPNLICTDESDSNHILLVGGSASKSLMQKYQIDLVSGNLSAQGKESKNTVAGGLSSVALLSGTVFLGSKTGLLFQSEANDKMFAVTINQVSRVTGAAFAQNSLFVSTQSGSFQISSNLFDPTNLVDQLTSSAVLKAVPSIPFNVDMKTLNERDLVVWEKNNNPRLWRFNSAKNMIEGNSGPVGLPLLQVKPKGKQVITVDSGGRIRIYDSVDLSLKYNRILLGTLGSDFLANGDIIANKGSGGKQDSPLIRVIPRTGESALISLDDELVSTTCAAPEEGWLYFLSISHGSGFGQSFLKRLSLSNPLLPSELLAKFSGDSDQGDMIFSKEKSRLFTSAGQNLITTWDGKNIETLEQGTRFPQRLIEQGNLILSVNQDGSLSVWNMQNRKFLCDIFFTLQGSGVILTKQGKWSLIEQTGLSSLNLSKAKISAEAVLKPNILSQEAGIMSIEHVTYPWGLD